MAGATHHVRIDRAKTLAEEPHTGHNRWHEAIPPVVTVAPGDRVILECRDAFDGQFSPTSMAKRLPTPDRFGSLRDIAESHGSRMSSRLD